MPILKLDEKEAEKSDNVFQNITKDMATYFGCELPRDTNEILLYRRWFLLGYTAAKHND